MDNLSPVQENHVMDFVKIHDSGVEEWLCKICGRRVIYKWTPYLNSIVLNIGSVYATHTGSKGGLSVGDVVPKDAEGLAADASEENNRLLGPWEDWMRENDFDRLWGE